MKFLILSGNPKTSGLCRSVENEIERGAADGGAKVERLIAGGSKLCRVCGDGWGPCRERHECAFSSDGFGEIQAALKSADALCLITPVYWGEMAEGLKGFLDRLRRCAFGQSGALSGKQVLLAACPGGSGNGALTCLEQMDRFCRHTGAQIFDYISVNRWNCDYKRAAAYAAARAIAEGRKNGETV